MLWVILQVHMKLDYFGMSVVNYNTAIGAVITVVILHYNYIANLPVCMGGSQGVCNSCNIRMKDFSDVYA